MSNAYAHGYDYDSYRNVTFDFPNEPFRELPKTQHKRKVLKLVLILFVLCPLIWYALQYIPFFDITKVTFTTSSPGTVVPSQAKELAQKTLGKSIMSQAPKKLKQALISLPMVEEVHLRRRLFSTLQVSLSMFHPETAIAVVEPSQVATIYLLKHGKLQEISPQDFAIYGNNVFVVEVSSAYGQHLQQYGLDADMQKVVELATQMGKDVEGRYRIVGTIRYQENLGKAFGNMIIDLPAYRSSLYIREPISESRLHDALGLIKLERENDQIRNVALIGQLRYDLYARALVSRQ